MKIPLGLMLVAVMLGHAPAIYAQNEITLIAPGGIRDALEQIIPNYERKTGRKVKATFGSGLGTNRSSVSSEPEALRAFRFDASQTDAAIRWAGDHTWQERAEVLTQVLTPA